MYFVLQIVAEVVRTLFDLEGMDKAEVLRFLERKPWPKVAYLDGRVGAVAQWVFVRLVLYVERMSRRGAQLKRTKKRLDDKLQEMVRAANWRERLRRAENVVAWTLQGIITTPELAKRVAEYESRGRTGDEPLWLEVVAASQSHEPAAKRALEAAAAEARARARAAAEAADLANLAVAAINAKHSRRRKIPGTSGGTPGAKYMKSGRKFVAGAFSPEATAAAGGAGELGGAAAARAGKQQGKSPRRTPKAGAVAAEAALRGEAVKGVYEDGKPRADDAV